MSPWSGHFTFLCSRCLLYKIGIIRLYYTAAAAAAKSLQSCPTLCDPMDCSLPGSSIHGIFQARVPEWGVIAFSNTILWSWLHTHFTDEVKLEWVSEVAQSCPTLGDPMDCSLPGSSLHGILQARVLEWVAISFSNAWKWKVKVKSPQWPHGL